VDLAGLDLAYIRAGEEKVTIGATTPLQALVDAPELDGVSLALLRHAARLEAGRNLRVAATVGGTLAVAGPEDPLTVVLLALDAEVQWAVGGGPSLHSGRAVALDDFLQEREKYLAQGGLMTEVAIPLDGAGSAAAFARVGRTPLDRLIVCAAAQLTLTDELCLAPRLALGGVAGRPVRLRQVEDIIAEKALGDDLLTAAVEAAMAAVSPLSDYRGSANYRRALAGILTRRVLVEAAELASTAMVDELGA
jgi:CO/xanthine dehydrogenase FAD-binding subunit